MRRARRTLGTGAAVALQLVALFGVTMPTRAGAAPDRGVPPQEAQTALELVRQTPVVEPRQTFTVWLAPEGLAADGNIEVVIHGRVRSRSELATSIDGIGLRAAIYQVVKPVSELPAASDGSRRLALSLDPATPGGIDLGAAGVYPVELVGRDAVGGSTATLTTHLILGPAAGDESPPLAVAVVADVGSPPAIAPDGENALSEREITRLTELLTALAVHPDTATLAIRPDLVAALEASGDAAHRSLLDLARAAAAAQSVLAMPFAPTSPDSLAAAGLNGELLHQLDRGRSVVAGALDATIDGSGWLAGDDLTFEGVTALAATGVRHVVLSSAQVEPLRPGLVTLSLAQPYRLSAPEASTVSEVDALTVDDGVVARLDGQGSPGLEVSRVLAELAVLWFERPGVMRSAVVPIDDGVRGEVVAGLLEGLGDGPVFRTASLREAFEAPRHLLQPGGAEVDRELAPEEPASIDRTVAEQLGAARRLLDSFRTLLDADATELPNTVESHLLLATSLALRHATQEQHLRTARGLMEDVVAGVSAPERETVTLTAREGTIPLTLLNDTGGPIHVVVRLRSPKLEFPDGRDVDLVLTGERTRVDIAVRTRASGSFPLDVEVTSPDGAISLASIDYSIQSTVVSGVGVVLSFGAALFLMVWWGRHWSRTRRSGKLVEAKHLRSDSSAPDPGAQ